MDEFEISTLAERQSIAFILDSTNRTVKELSPPFTGTKGNTFVANIDRCDERNPVMSSRPVPQETN
jgi:hypothetical protein